MSTIQLQNLLSGLKPFQQRLINHPLYNTFQTLDDLHVFMESHVFAVWDFMSLLKALQQKLTCVSLPWVPSGYHQSTRLINEIVLGEESDQYGTDSISHFALYLQAMQECGASVTAIKTLLAAVREGITWDQALLLCNAPSAARQFVHSTFSMIEENKLPTVAAAFTFGREDIIPDLFRQFIEKQDRQLQGKLKILRWYLERHINVDKDDHGPMALEMLMEICGHDQVKWHEAEKAAAKALQARIDLWDNITTNIQIMQENNQLAVNI